MTYQITLTDRAQREQHIARELVESNKTDPFYEYRGTHTELKIISLPIGLPIYRMENFRTFSDQAEYLARENKPSDFFQTGQENESVQQIQHDILAKLAAKGTSSVVPILDVLDRDGQRQNILITHSGAVVNGNRRLAAMRELAPKFSHVKCAVLPKEATREDILEIEGKLQAIPETRLDYDWIGDAKFLTALLVQKGKPENVAAFLGRKTTEVKVTLQALAEAELYLKEWVKAPGKYYLVAENGEQLFNDFAAEIQGKPEYLKEASRAIAWTLFEKRARLTGRLYNYNLTFGKRAPEVLDRLADELGVALETKAEAGDAEFEFSIEPDNVQPSYIELISVLRDGPRKDDAADQLISICDSVIESEKDKKKENAALKSISAANAKLTEVELGRAGEDTWGAIERQLDSITERALQLKTQLAALKSSSTKSNAG